MQRNLSLYLHIHCRAINIFISHNLLPSDLVAQSVEQRWSNSKVVGSNPTLVRVFLCPCVGPFPSVGLTLTWYMGWNISTSNHIVSLFQVQTVCIIAQVKSDSYAASKNSALHATTQWTLTTSATLANQNKEKFLTWTDWQKQLENNPGLSSLDFYYLFSTVDLTRFSHLRIDIFNW